MFKSALIIILTFLFLSCGKKELTLQTFSTKISNSVEIDSIYSRAMQNFENGKRFSQLNLLDSARTDFLYLANQFNHKKSKSGLSDLDTFFTNYLAEYDSLVAIAKKRKLLFTAAGYYRKILNFFPENVEAKTFLESNKDDIEKRLTLNVERGQTYVKQRRLRDAKRCFNLVLTFNPDHEIAQKGLEDVRKIEQEIRIANARRKANQDKVSGETTSIVPKLTAEEKEKLYILGINAYRKNEYVKALEYFESIDDKNYKDTLQYLNLTQDKINAQELTDD
ncbi:MAG: hypothetical protein KDD94_03955 [Calditrichaeota bacterium]|nr:hypothetical protein [Calditrichota bacterium]